MAEYRKSITLGAMVAVLAASILAASSIYLAPNPVVPSTSTFPGATTLNLTTSNGFSYFYCENPCTIVIQNGIPGNGSPAIVTLGTNVTWVNLDDTQHTVTDDAGAFSSHFLSPEQSFSHVFKEAGNFTYHDLIHPMMGTVVVQEHSPVLSTSVLSGHIDRMLFDDYFVVYSSVNGSINYPLMCPPNNFSQCSGGSSPGEQSINALPSGLAGLDITSYLNVLAIYYHSSDYYVDLSTLRVLLTKSCAGNSTCASIAEQNFPFLSYETTTIWTGPVNLTITATITTTVTVKS